MGILFEVSMGVPQRVIKLVSTIVKAEGRPHFVYSGNERIDSGCIEWRLPPESEGYFALQDRRNVFVQEAIDIYALGREKEAQALFEAIDQKIAPHEPKTPEADVNSLLFEVRELLRNEPLIAY